MSFGKMNQIIQLIQTIQNKDAAGFVSSEDVVLATVRAYREDRHGNELWANRAAFSTATALFRFRVIPNIMVTTAMTIVCSGERFKIVSVENVRQRGMYLEVLAEHTEPSKG